MIVNLVGEIVAGSADGLGKGLDSLRLQTLELQVPLVLMIKVLAGARRQAGLSL